MRKLLLATIAFLILLLCNTGLLHAFCFDSAGSQYNIAPGILRAIAKIESQMNPAAINYNRNGTYDFCLMQINSEWAKVIGPDAWSALGDPCYCTRVGAWILTQCITAYGYTWEAVGCYHAGAGRTKTAEAYKYVGKVQAAVYANKNPPRTKVRAVVLE